MILNYELDIDFKQLKEQKLALIAGLNDGTLPDCLNGVLSLMDEIQDIAVDKHGENPEVVFCKVGE